MSEDISAMKLCTSVDTSTMRGLKYGTATPLIPFNTTHKKQHQTAETRTTKYSDILIRYNSKD